MYILLSQSHKITQFFNEQDGSFAKKAQSFLMLPNELLQLVGAQCPV